jgi:integrase
MSKRSSTTSSTAFAVRCNAVGVKIKFWKRGWWVFVHHEGRRKTKRVGDRETATRVAQAIREKLARGELNLGTASDSQTSQTLRAYANTWLATVQHTLKASTLDFYEANLKRHVLPTLGERR